MADQEQSPDEAALVTATSVLMPGTRLTYFFEETDRRERVEESLYRAGELVVARTETGESDGELPEIATRGEILDAARPGPERLMAIVGGIERVRYSSDAAEDEGWVQWRTVDESAADDRASRVRAGDVLGLLQRLADRGIEMAASVREDLVDEPPSRVADIAASVAYEEVDRHQELLEEPDVLERLTRVERQLDRLLNELDDEPAQ